MDLAPTSDASTYVSLPHSSHRFSTFLPSVSATALKVSAGFCPASPFFRLVSPSITQFSLCLLLAFYQIPVWFAIFLPIDFQPTSVSVCSCALVSYCFPSVILFSSDCFCFSSSCFCLTCNWIPLASRLVSFSRPIEFYPPFHPFPSFAHQTSTDFYPAYTTSRLFSAMFPTVSA